MGVIWKMDPTAPDDTDHMANQMQECGDMYPKDWSSGDDDEAPPLTLGGHPADLPYDWDSVDGVELVYGDLPETFDVTDVVNAVWTTKEGERLRVRDMSTSHIQNCVAMIKRKPGWRLRWLALLQNELQARTRMLPAPAPDLITALRALRDRK